MSRAKCPKCHARIVTAGLPEGPVAFDAMPAGVGHTLEMGNGSLLASVSTFTVYVRHDRICLHRERAPVEE